MSHLELVALVVREYEPAIEFFARGLGSALVEDEPSLTDDGRPKRWVVVRPLVPRPASCWLARTETFTPGSSGSSLRAASVSS